MLLKTLFLLNAVASWIYGYQVRMSIRCTWWDLTVGELLDPPVATGRARP
jgi:hypothetical protein